MYAASLPKHESTLIGGGVTLDHVFAEILQLKADVAALRADHTLTQVHLRNYFSQQQQHQQQPAVTAMNAPAPPSTAAAAAEPVVTSTSNSTAATPAPTSTTATTVAPATITAAKKRKASQDPEGTASASQPAAKTTKKARAGSKSIEPETLSKPLSASTTATTRAPDAEAETAEKEVTVIEKVERRGRPRKSQSVELAPVPVPAPAPATAKKQSLHDLDTVSERDDSSDDNKSKHESERDQDQDSDTGFVEKHKHTPKAIVRAAKKKLKPLPKTDDDDDDEEAVASNASDSMDVDKPTPKKRAPRKAAMNMETPKRSTPARKTANAELVENEEKPVADVTVNPVPASSEASPKKRGAPKKVAVTEPIVAAASTTVATYEESADSVAEASSPKNSRVESFPTVQPVDTLATPANSVPVPTTTASASTAAKDPFEVPLDDGDVKPSPSIAPPKKTKVSKKAVDLYDVEDAKDSNSVRTPNDPNSGWHFNLKYGAEVEAYSKQYKAWYLGKILYYIALPGNKYKIKIHYVGYSKQFDEVFDISSAQGRSLLRPYKNKKLSLGLKADETVHPTQWDPNGKQPYGLESDVTREGELFIQKE
ncbi:UNVERIFIED_CONTAM: hypothetical protein HDU68_002450 [Siphonaria sp. JEL0065]|nr:hypothetical protein HDU68_002450 [Siphonaria sp. JEL0065]